MNFIEYLGIAVAPSLTLGLVIFFAKNWFLERLKNSIKHEYDRSLEKFKGDLKHDNDKSLEKFKGDLKHDNDKSLEKFKGDLKIENDKELEEIKAILKKQTDVSLEDYRFQIEIRKKWLNDVREASIEYLSLIRRQINIVQEFVATYKPVPKNTTDENYNKCLEKVSKGTVEVSSLTFKLETLIVGVEPFSTNIINSITQINKISGEITLEHQIRKIPINANTKDYIELQKFINIFKVNIMDLLKKKSEKL